MNYEENEVTINPANHHFEMIVDGETAFIDYRQKKDQVYLIHTEVPQHLRGRGIGTSLIEKTLDHLEKHELKLIPYCATIKNYLEKHPQWQRLLAQQT